MTRGSGRNGHSASRFEANTTTGAIPSLVQEAHCDGHFRPTYEREFLPVQNLWRDFLVHSEETGLTVAA
jgi:hypothetical protein